ncbi:MAG: hypothetical protein Q7W45_02900 [Bacteroidota bacterium]|nr:hypothetical protein [Bacteroidota bacterium]MDP3145797.1 hypothetical protein [Bacteroidota bacterium]MDP3558431.1 hypothetical protein [Bacteroidota bacterium]
MKVNTFIFIISSILFFSCAKKKIPDSSVLLGLDYYPTTIGKFVVYNVDSTIYNSLTQTSVTTQYQIKEKITENFIDNEGQEALRLERFIKKFNPLKSYDSMPWMIKEVWMINATNKSIQVVEGNVRFTKLIFPIQQFANWNGNAKNTIGEWLYSYNYIDKSETIGTKVLDKVLLVKQKENRTLISYQNYNEKYAKGIGLVYREITDVLSNNVIANVPVEGRIEDGIIYKQTLVNYGYE